MTLLWRSWFTVASVIFVVLAGLAGLNLFQNSALLSGLTQQRIAVVAETVGAAFKPIADLGLPISMVRNGDNTLKRLQQTDPAITAIHVFNPSGIIVYSTDVEGASAIGDEELRAWRLAQGDAWAFEGSEALFAGWTIRRKNGDVVGGVLVSYPTEHLSANREATMRRTVLRAILLWVIFSLAALAVLRVALRQPIRAIARIGDMSVDDPETRSRRKDDLAHQTDTVLDPMDELAANLAKPDRQAATIAEALSELGSSEVANPGPERSAAPDALVKHSPNASQATALARLLTPLALALALLPAFILGALSLDAATKAVAPEIEARFALIGSIVSANVQRAVSAGIPIDALSGGANYFGGLLSEFPEIGYLAIANGSVIVEAGTSLGEFSPGSRYPIVHNDARVGEVVIEMAPDFVASRYVDVFLDVGVIVIASILVAFEVLALMLSRTLTAPLNQLSHLAALQAAGNFSHWTEARRQGAINRLIAGLSQRAVSFNCSFAELVADAGRHKSRLETLGRRYRLGASGARKLVFAYLTDIRLALFLFSVADELPLSFMPLYTRAADNPLPWINEGVLLSLPLAGYLLAILLASPFARQFARRYGHRRVLVFGVVPALLGQIGLVMASSAIEIIAFRTVTGFGYAIVTLVCQDYVIDVTPTEEQPQSLAQFSLVLFGGVFAGTALGGVLADRLGFSVVFAISAGLILISVFLFQRLLPVWSDRPSGSQGDRLFPPLLGPLRNRRFAGLVLGIAIPWNIQNQAFICYLVALILDGLGSTPSDIGRLLMLNYLVLALVSPVITRFFGSRVQPAFLALIGAFLAGSALLPASVDLTALTILGAVLAGGLGQGIVRGPQVSVALDIAENESVEGGPDGALAALRTLERGGSIIGLIIIAAIAGLLGYKSAVLAVAAWVLVGALLFLLTEFILPRSGASARPHVAE